ncbi:uncharacterized protein LOC110976823 isoform X2 [Acanthaster planci]|nr:uncharacterized protein LOC110976823 isoform X2 [Acanthaster planci]
MAEGGPDDMEQGLTDRKLGKLSDHLAGEWQKLAAFLGLNAAQVEKIKYDFEGTDNRIFQMLLKWKQQAKEEDLIGTLQGALRDVGRNDLVEKLSGPQKIKKHEDEIICPQHMNTVKQFYCETCQVLVCPYSTANHPEPHVMHSNAEVSIKYKTTLRDQIQCCTSAGREIEEALQVVEEVKQCFEKALEDVKEAAARAMKQIEAEQKRWLNEIENQRRVHIECSNLRKTLTDWKEKHTSMMEHAKVVMESKTDSKFLLEYPATAKSLEELAREIPIVVGTQTECRPSRPKFLQGQAVHGIDLGKVVMVDVWEQCGTIGNRGGNSGELEGAHGITTSEPDRIAVTDRENKRVVIFDSQGNCLQSINAVTNDIAATPKVWIVVNPLVVKLYSRDDAQLIREFHPVPPDEIDKTEVNLFGVAVKKNSNIIVGDCKRKVLTELSQDGRLLHTVSVELKPYFLAVLDDDLIAISDMEQATVQVVDLSEGVAAKVTTLHPNINGRPAESCRGVCGDRSGIYIVASTGSFNSGHIHHHDIKGQFITCVAENLYNPYGITFKADEQQLAVADLHSVKMYRKAAPRLSCQ